MITGLIWWLVGCTLWRKHRQPEKYDDPYPAGRKRPIVRVVLHSCRVLESCEATTEAPSEKILANKHVESTGALLTFSLRHLDTRPYRGHRIKEIRDGPSGKTGVNCGKRTPSLSPSPWPVLWCTVASCCGVCAFPRRPPRDTTSVRHTTDVVHSVLQECLMLVGKLIGMVLATVPRTVPS